jgi:TRAP-type C4-dicarboxylate transport system substrate-binding protein
MRALRALLATLAVLGLGACKVDYGERPGVYRLVYASPYNPGHPFSQADIAWMKWVEDKSGGRIDIVPAWNASLISSEQSMVELRHGVADIGLITPVYSRHGVHLVRAQSGFYGGVKSIEDQVAVYNCLEAEFPTFREELAGLHVLAVQGGPLPGIVTRSKPVRRLEDMKGLRIRAPVELLPLLRRLGADPVNMPMAEVYSSLAKGVIDGVISSPDTFRSLHFAEVSKYYTGLVVSRGAYPARAISEQSWNRLPPDLRKLLDESGLVWEAALADKVGASVKIGEDFGRKSGIVFLPFSAEDQAVWNAAYNEEALASARGLKRYGVDGEPVFRRAQALSADLAAGRGLACTDQGA